MARHPPPGRIAPSFGLTNTLAKGWGRSQVVVNAVAFGLVKTRLTEAPANPEDAANAVYLLHPGVGLHHWTARHCRGRPGPMT